MPCFIERRKFLAGAGASLVSLLGIRQREAMANSDILFTSACQFAHGGFGVVVMNESGIPLFQTDLPDRGHDVVVGADRAVAITFARRPGTFAVAIRLDRSVEPQLFHTPVSRHFYGHGAFSNDSKLLFASENDFGTGDGKIGIYDATDRFRRIGEFDSHGIGPHDIALLPGGQILAVCNGGIRTHPTMARAKLNLSTMQPNIAFLDAATGTLIERHQLDPQIHQMSVRHLDVISADQVVFGGQFQGTDNRNLPLFGTLKLGAQLQWFDMSENILNSFGGYVGSVSASPDGTAFAATSHHNNIAALFDAKTGKLKTSLPMSRASGVAWRGLKPFISSLSGEFGDFSTHSRGAILFDNHLSTF